MPEPLVWYAVYRKTYKIYLGLSCPPLRARFALWMLGFKVVQEPREYVLAITTPDWWHTPNTQVPL